MAVVTPTFCIHLENTDDAPAWWATSDDVPGLTALAGSLPELRERIRAVLLEEGIGDGNFREALAGIASGENRIVVCL